MTESPKKGAEVRRRTGDVERPEMLDEPMCSLVQDLAPAATELTVAAE